MNSISNDGLFFEAVFNSSKACCLFFSFSRRKNAKLILSFVSFGNLGNFEKINQLK